MLVVFSSLFDTLSGSTGLVERTPFLCYPMFPFCVYPDSGKNLVKLLVLMSVHVR